MQTVLTIIQIILGIFTIGLIFLQSSGETESSNLLSTISFRKRGWEKVTFFATIFVIVTFIITAIIQTLY